eukprot:15464281-Alexandrium_andersonii.AAC.1
MASNFAGLCRASLNITGNAIGLQTLGLRRNVHRNSASGKKEADEARRRPPAFSSLRQHPAELEPRSNRTSPRSGRTANRPDPQHAGRGIVRKT